MFWLVWNEGNRAPTVKHWTEQSARNEAERLARQNPGQKFIILESQRFCFYHSPVIWEKTKDEIPF